MRPGINSLILAHENESSQGLYEKSRLFWETWPFKPFYHIEYASLKRMSWKETRSSLRIATARNETTGRSRTIQVVHASETAFWDNADTLMVGLRNTMPDAHGTLLIIESTANGMGNWYHQTWQEACMGINEFIPVFYPWFKHYEYRLNIDVKYRNELLHSEDPNEVLLMNLGAGAESLAWRRWAIPQKCHGSEDYFKQEYPATPTEAFLSKGRNIFHQEKLDSVYKPIPSIRGYIERVGNRSEFVQNEFGPLTIFRWPSRRAEYFYFVGADPTRSLYGDAACIQVINRQTMEQVAVWHGHIDPVSLGKEIMNLGYYYKEAEVTSEVEGGGYGTIGAILAMEYPNVWMHRWADKHPGKVSGSNYGWSTNYNRKRWAIGTLLKMVNDGSITLHDQITYDQMSKYVVLNDYGDMGNADQGKGYDDAVMALAITVTCMISEGPDGIRASGPMPAPSDIMGVAPWDAYERA